MKLGAFLSTFPLKLVKIAILSPRAQNDSTDALQFFPDAVAIALGTNIIRAAEAVGVKHVVFSSAPHASKLTNGRVCFNSLDGEVFRASLVGKHPVVYRL